MKDEVQPESVRALLRPHDPAGFDGGVPVARETRPIVTLLPRT